jgi:nucleotide-binding universal stress UspA family protein
MTDDKTDRSIKAEIGDVTYGQVGVGTQISQSQTVLNAAAPPTAAELEALTAAFAELKAKVEREAPPEVRVEAVRQTEALQQATIAEKPDVSVMAAAKRWFLAHAPGLLGAVTSVVINPIVGKIVSSAGDAIAKEYQTWFPEAGAPSEGK